MRRLTTRSLMLAVLLVAVFLAGVKVGRNRAVFDGPTDRAMAYVRSIRTGDDREATAIFLAAHWRESLKPGSLHRRVTAQAIPGREDGVWNVSFTDPSIDACTTQRVSFHPEEVEEYRDKRRRGVWSFLD